MGLAIGPEAIASGIVSTSPVREPARISRAPVIVVVAFFAVALTLVLIGAQLSARSAPPPTIGSPGTPASPRAVTVIMRDYLFDPRPLVLIRGETVRLTIFDEGMLPHEFALGGLSVQDAWERADAAATPPVPFATPPPASVLPSTGGLRVFLWPGESATVDYTVPESGGLALMCHLPGHIERWHDRPASGARAVTGSAPIAIH